MYAVVAVIIVMKPLDEISPHSMKLPLHLHIHLLAADVTEEDSGQDNRVSHLIGYGRGSISMQHDIFMTVYCKVWYAGELYSAAT